MQVRVSQSKEHGDSVVALLQDLPDRNAAEGEESIRIAQDRLTHWRSVGAQASPTVERLIKQAAKKAA